jgi:hypothetical protein
MPDEYDAHDLLRAVYQNPAFPITTRAAAAKAALPYERPALASIRASVTGDVGLVLGIPVAARDRIETASVEIVPAQ